MKTKEDIEREIFFLEMKDHWDSVDWDYYNELRKELQDYDIRSDNKSNK